MSVFSIFCIVLLMFFYVVAFNLKFMLCFSMFSMKIVQNVENINPQESKTSENSLHKNMNQSLFYYFNLESLPAEEPRERLD